MRASRVLVVALCGAGLFGSVASGCDGAKASSAESNVKQLPAGAVRVATFNASLNRGEAGELLQDLSDGDNLQARATAEIIQRVRPDILLLNEFDYDGEGRAAALFQDNYLSAGQGQQLPIEFGYRYVVAPNTGIDSGHDLDNDGELGGPGDAHGFGEFEGQYGFVVYSRYPIQRQRIRTFREFLWRDMPGATFPSDEFGAWYEDEELATLRLSSKNHVDVPIDVAGVTLHVLAHHPTPPAFDGSEDRNGLRNEAEIRFWADYLTPLNADYIYDDDGLTGGLAEAERFVILGDHNADPLDGSSRPGAMGQLLGHARINTSMTPTSEGAVVASEQQGGMNDEHATDAATDTGDFGDDYLGNLRLDYALPSANVDMLDAQVFWPAPDDEAHSLIEHSDHRLVWVDLQLL